MTCLERYPAIQNKKFRAAASRPSLLDALPAHEARKPLLQPEGSKHASRVAARGHEAQIVRATSSSPAENASSAAPISGDRKAIRTRLAHDAPARLALSTRVGSEAAGVHRASSGN